MAVVRADDVLVELDGGFRVAQGDSMFICGSAEATRRYSESFAEAAA